MAELAVPMELPRGRHGLSRETIRASQRLRLLDAMIAVSAELGFPNVTISHVVERARVARRTFYEHFESREACFIEAYDHTTEEIIAPLIGAFHPVADVRSRLRAYVDALLAALAARPALARMLLVEVAAGGTVALERRLEMHRRIATAIVELNTRTRELGIEIPPLSISRALALVGGLIELMQATLLDAGPEALPALSDELTDIVVVLIEQPSTVQAATVPAGSGLSR